MLISGDSCLRVWNQQNSTLIYTFDIGVNQINDMSFTRDGRVLIVGSDSDRIQMIDLYKSENPPELVVNKNKSQLPIKVSAIGCSSDGSKLGIGTTSGVINVFNASNFELLFSSYVHKGEITSIGFHPSSNHVIASDTKGKISFSALKGGAPKMLPHWTSKLGDIFEFDISPHKLLLAVACKTGLLFYDLEKMVKLTGQLPQFSGHPTKVKFSPTDPNLVAFSTSMNELFFLNTSNNSLSEPVSFDNEVISIDFRNDGVYLAVGVNEVGLMTVDVRDLSTNHKFQCENGGQIKVVKFQPLDIDDLPKFKQTVIAETPKITKPNIQSKLNESTKSALNSEKKKTTTSFSRLPQQPKQQQQQIVSAVNKIGEMINDIDVDININLSDKKNMNEIEIEEDVKVNQYEVQKNNQFDLPKGENSKKSPVTKQKVQSPVKPKPVITKSPQKLQQVPEPQNSESSSEYDSDFDLDLSKVPVENQEGIRIICNYTKHLHEIQKEEMHQHLNTIHLDLLCRINEIKELQKLILEKINGK